MAAMLGVGILGFTAACFTVRKVYQLYNTRGRRNEEAEEEHDENTDLTPNAQDNITPDDREHDGIVYDREHDGIVYDREHDGQEGVENATVGLEAGSTEAKMVGQKREVNESLRNDNEHDVENATQNLKSTTANEGSAGERIPEQEIDFEKSPTFVKTIRTKAAKTQMKAIFGLSVLNQELFIISEHSTDVEVYDCGSLDFKRQFQLECLFDPIDIKSCSRNNCLYIFDWKVESSEIFRIGSNGELITKWTTGDDGPDGGYISVTPEANVLLSVWDKSLLKEFTADGRLLHEIQLSSSISELRLAIKLSNGNFIISQGEDEESEHRICLVDDKGFVLKSIGGKQGSLNGEFDGPNYLVVDESGFILVADQNNRRVVLLSPDLEFRKEVIQERDDLRYPVRMDSDRTSGRLFIADNDYVEGRTGWRDGRLKVFDFEFRP